MSRKAAVVLGLFGLLVVLIVIGSLSQAANKTTTPSSSVSVSSQNTKAPAVSPSASASAATASTDSTITTVLGMLAELPEDDAPASHTGYERDYFRIWIDADGDGCNTRAEVLISESQTTTTNRGTCTIETGQWFSSYDGLSFANAGDVDIDHFVPLNEAWISGAYAWDSQTRVSYGNDLGYDASLLAVSAHSNRSKSDKDPSKWLPSAQNYLCDYSATWVAVKWRWNLSVDSLERNTLNQILSGCAATSIALPERAVVILGQTPQQPATSDGLDPDYGTCSVVRANGKGPYIQGVDPEYDWYIDRDKDAMVCE